MKNLLLAAAFMLAGTLCAQDFDSMTSTEITAHVKQAVEAIGNGQSNAMDSYEKWFQKNNPNKYLVAGEIVYPRSNQGISIPSSAMVTNKQTYDAGDSNWITYELKDGNTHYSITLDRTKYNIVSRFTSVNK